MTLVEVMVAAGVLAITAMSGFSGFLLLNRYAANLRNITVARSLCQERIEQAMTLPFRPGASTPVVPSAPSADPTSTGARTILGTATNYTNGAFNAGNDVQTSTETIPFFTKQESTNITTDPTVVFTRTVTVSPANLNAYASSGAGASLNIIKFTVTVSWTFRNSNYSTAMTALRSPD